MDDYLLQWLVHTRDEADILLQLKRKIKCIIREYVRTKLFAVCDITFDDVMCIPISMGQADRTLFTRPFLSS